MKGPIACSCKMWPCPCGYFRDLALRSIVILGLSAVLGLVMALAIVGGSK